jgi:hypothetical protein
MNEFTTRALIIGIIGANNAAKQNYGRQFAAKLGLEPGNEGPDDGIDGFGSDENGRRIHFQCKLRGELLDKDDARMYYSDLIYHKIDISIRDFQKLNSPSCGMGILARPRFRAGRMPTPQENFDYFFIWKSLMLAGEGYKDTFKQRLFGHPNIDNIKIHLLTLRDVFEETKIFILAKADLPKLDNLADVAS